MDREAWRAAVHRVTQSQTRLSNRTAARNACPGLAPILGLEEAILKNPSPSPAKLTVRSSPTSEGCLVTGSLGSHSAPGSETVLQMNPCPQAAPRLVGTQRDNKTITQSPGSWRSA